MTMSAGELLAAFAARELSPVEVLQDCEARIDPRLGAFQALCLERARAEAHTAEAAWARGEPTGPLCGIPIAVKDLIDTEGVETARGSSIFAGFVPGADAECVRRVRAAGAIVIGKTTTHEFAWGMSMAGRDGEPLTRNPRDPDRMTGGSSGGSAVAVACGVAPLALGTDTGGSIRLPAGWCGIHGFKPTHGLLSLEGVWPLAPGLDHVGPMASTAADCALVFEILGGPAVTAEAATGARVAGSEVLPDGSVAADVYRVLMLSEALATHRAAGLWPTRATEYTPAVLDRLERAESVTDDERAWGRGELDRMRSHMRAVFEDCDLVRSPVASMGPPRFSENIDPRDVAAPHVVLQDLLGLPALALPDGTQLTGARGDDVRVLAAAL
jgi:Asp-tRNA(Asn)/Glu-tRNA(Gln) amidotransferase A subunit family amidase